MKIYTKIFALMVLFPLFAAPTFAQGKGDATLIKVDMVRSEISGQTVPVVGRLLPDEAGTVASLSKGLIASFEVSVGDRLEVGQIIAIISPTSLALQRDLEAASVAEAQGKAKEAQAQAKLAQNSVKRLEGLRKSAAFNQGLTDDKKAEYARTLSSVAVAKAAVLRAKANLGLAEVDLYNADIRAPYNGVVTERHTEVGSFVNVGGPVVSMVNDHSLEIEADVPASRLGGLTPGMTVTAELSKGISISAVIRAVVPNENPRTRTRVMRLTPDIPDTVRNLAANQSVTVLLPIGGGMEMVTVAKDAVLRRKGVDVVYVVKDGQAMKTDITIGQALGNRFQVLSGLSAGDLVVVRGNERLRPGQKVRYEK